MHVREINKLHFKFPSQIKIILKKWTHYFRWAKTKNYYNFFVVVIVVEFYNNNNNNNNNKHHRIMSVENTNVQPGFFPIKQQKLFKEKKLCCIYGMRKLDSFRIQFEI